MGLFIPLEPKAEVIRTEGHYSCAVKQIINIQPSLERKQILPTSAETWPFDFSTCLSDQNIT